MSVFFSFWPALWAQANAATPPWLIRLMWFYIASDPNFRSEDLIGNTLTWVKAISLLCLVCWVVSWLVRGIKERVIGQGHWSDYFGVAALVLTPLAVMLRVLESMNRMGAHPVLGLGATAWVVIACVVCFTVWAEVSIAHDPAVRATSGSGGSNRAQRRTRRGSHHRHLPPAADS